MEFYYTYVCPRCEENRDISGLKRLNPAKCRVCGKKVIAVKIYMDYLEGYEKPSIPVEKMKQKPECPACEFGIPVCEQSPLPGHPWALKERDKKDGIECGK